MDHLRQLLLKIPSTLWDFPDGVYGDVDAFLAWLGSPDAAEAIQSWEQRQRTILDGVMRGLEGEATPVLAYNRCPPMPCDKKAR